jgi:hypothetical protein|tara:strand:+ start:147 stop:317 length:171 start_codon:yes stop_codon:yes gene_type:complete
MAENLIEQAKESADMATKMTALKNAMMQNDLAVGMARKFGAVKLTTFNNNPVSVST